MFLRGISTAMIRQAVAEGEVIRTYPDDRPFPSVLVLAHIRAVSLHVVVASESTTGRCHIITVYWPDPMLWDDDFRERKR